MVRLRSIARFWDVELGSTRQRDMAIELAEAMASPDGVSEAWEALPADQRQALDALLAAGGEMASRVFSRQWGEIRSMGPGRMGREKPWRTPVSPAEGLWYRGFFYLAFEQGPEGAYEVAFVPPDLLAHLPQPGDAERSVSLEPLSIKEPPAVEAAGEAIVDDACTLLAYLQNESVRPAASGVWPDAHLRAIRTRLRDSGAERLNFLRHLVDRLGWLRVMDGGQLRPEPEPVTRWLNSPASEERVAFFEAWRVDKAWNDLAFVPTLRLENTGAWRNDPLLARKAILRHLERCTPGEWYDLDEFIALVKQIDPDFQRPDGDYASWYVRDLSTDRFLSGFESWDRVEGALIRYLIGSPLAWLGATDVGRRAPDGPAVAFRLTLAGAALLGVEEPPPPPAYPAPLVRPDFTVHIDPGRCYDRFRLARVADWVNSPPIGAEASRFVYRMTPASLSRARQQGIPVTRVLDFLAELAESPIPRTIEAALTRWEARGAEARIERAVVLRLASEDLMEQALAAPQTRHLIDERVGPQDALVRETDISRLVRALGEMGLLPDVELVGAVQNQGANDEG